MEKLIAVRSCADPSHWHSAVNSNEAIISLMHNWANCLEMLWSRKWYGNSEIFHCTGKRFLSIENVTKFPGLYIFQNSWLQAYNIFLRETKCYLYQASELVLFENSWERWCWLQFRTTFCGHALHRHSLNTVLSNPEKSEGFLKLHKTVRGGDWWQLKSPQPMEATKWQWGPPAPAAWHHSGRRKSAKD